MGRRWRIVFLGRGVVVVVVVVVFDFVLEFGSNNNPHQPPPPYSSTPWVFHVSFEEAVPPLRHRRRVHQGGTQLRPRSRPRCESFRRLLENRREPGWRRRLGNRGRAWGRGFVLGDAFTLLIEKVVV